jgi:peptidoglycan hydrolase-like protein with peptidoglycan-binding domain
MPGENLKINMRGEAVKELHDLLRKLGYSIKDRSGFFGASTRDAVLDVQRKNKLRATGVVSSNTLVEITRLALATVTPSSGRRVIPKNSLGNKKNAIGKRLRKWRIEKGWKGYQAAKSIGISQGSLSDIENGNSYPSALTIIKLMKKTGIDIYWLLGVKK